MARSLCSYSIIYGFHLHDSYEIEMVFATIIFTNDIGI